MLLIKVIYGLEWISKTHEIHHWWFFTFYYIFTLYYTSLHYFTLLLHFIVHVSTLYFSFITLSYTFLHLLTFYFSLYYTNTLYFNCSRYHNPDWLLFGSTFDILSDVFLEISLRIGNKKIIRQIGSSVDHQKEIVTMCPPHMRNAWVTTNIFFKNRDQIFVHPRLQHVYIQSISPRN